VAAFRPQIQSFKNGKRCAEGVFPGQLNLALKIVPNVRVGEGSSIDSEIEQFAEAMNATR
jgi:hypothetical protein